MSSNLAAPTSFGSSESLGSSVVGNEALVAWNSVPVREYWEGDYRNFESRERGFTSAYRFHGCLSSALTYRYYGAAKASRTVTLKQFCPPDYMSCTPGSTIYSSWRAGW